MIRRLRKKTNTFFTQGHERTLLIKKNVAVSFGIKGITVLTSLIMVPLTINYVNPERNGIWLTLYSMVVWLNLFDIGFGNGMKNKVAEAKAQGDNELARKYISSTYAIITLLCLIMFLLFCSINPFVDWVKVLGSNEALLPYKQEISGLIWIMVASFCALFILNLFKSVVVADQRPAISSFIDMIGQLLALLGIFILSKTTEPSLIYLGWVTGFTPVLVYCIATVVFFKGRYRAWRPSWKQIDLKLAGKMMNLGVKFFIATIAACVITQTLPFLILQVSHPIEVTNYNTSYRFFVMAFNVIAIVIMPYWISFTDAYTQKDFSWMKRSVKQLRKFFIYLLVFQVVLLICSPLVYYIGVNYWITDAADMLSIPFTMSLAICVYVCVQCWLTINIYPLNGIGKVDLQVWSSIVEMLLMIPLALYLGHRWGATGVIVAPCLVYLPRMIWAPIQLHKLINNKASGIWNR
ncbi:MAG: hypothetical protein LBS25_03555 [Candidatus Symbiothrix sp.]|jgi:O-antigen/teichoic acid export membrane protein|nr:hypothetical protein [Candidatus Symbiothrix sp.]